MFVSFSVSRGLEFGQYIIFQYYLSVFSILYFNIVFIINVTLFSIWFTYILIKGLSVTVSRFLMI